MILSDNFIRRMQPLSRSRWLSGAELLIGAAIVIGHNVYKLLPNEVPILFVLGVISLRLRGGDWAALGFRRPRFWWRLVAIALGAAVLRILLGALVIEPLTAHIWPMAKAPAGTGAIAGHPLVALKWLGVVWTFAAFGEEMVYRRYLIERAADLGGNTRIAYWLAMVLCAVLFGFGHYYKGSAGMVDSTVAGLILGSVYLLCGRNLWVSVLAHGFIDTTGVLFAFFGAD